MLNKWYLYFAQKKFFWRIISLWKRITFGVGKTKYLIRYGINDERTNIQSFFGLLSIAKTQLFVALVTSLLLQFIDMKLSAIYSYLHIKSPDDGMYSTLFNSVSAISGVFIA
ncbi:hypothetical protein M3172_20625 [Mesobacillus subterraneus]|uniref:hypothetical protein n=1 Tax=Mesobacillus subterraneus TaxID=285983 RepID=UPI00203B45A9|nr:hypothetical protein [Mesobacillus subterraneus]MCM3575601.1 hypothetical protein [Mesobacillus subterraneus]